MKKYFIYTWHVFKHKWYTLAAITTIPRTWLFQKNEPFRLLVVLWRLIVHDTSKFLPDEYFPYMNFFYGADAIAQKGMTIVRRPRSDAQDVFDRAWMKHAHRNPHHWQYWLLRQADGTYKPLCPPMSYIIEMICDWVGASKAIRGKNANVKEWFNHNKDTMKMHAIAYGLAGNYMERQK